MDSIARNRHQPYIKITCLGDLQIQKLHNKNKLPLIHRARYPDHIMSAESLMPTALWVDSLKAT